MEENSDNNASNPEPVAEPQVQNEGPTETSMAVPGPLPVESEQRPPVINEPPAAVDRNEPPRTPEKPPLPAAPAKPAEASKMKPVDEHSPHVTAAIVATVVIVLGIAMLALYAYLQQVK